MKTPLPNVTMQQVPPGAVAHHVAEGGPRRAVERREPARVAVEQVAGVVPRDRLDEDADPAVAGQVEAAAQQPGRAVRMAGDGHGDPRDVAQHGERVVVVEVAAEALLVGQPGDPDDHAVVVLAVGEEPQRGGLTAELVLGVVQVGEVLDLGHRQEPREAGAQRRAEDGLLVEQGVEDAGRRRSGPAARA